MRSLNYSLLVESRNGEVSYWAFFVWETVECEHKQEYKSGGVEFKGLEEN